MKNLPKAFPFRMVLQDFLSRYRHCTTYWYVPKTRALSDENVNAMKEIVKLVFDEFIGRVWNPATQDELLKRLVSDALLRPTAEKAGLSDRTALVRIWKKWLETLGFLWVQDDKEIIVTDAALELITVSRPREIVEGQIAKLQYPSPSLKGSYAGDFKAILPHLFLLQVLQGNKYQISFDEYELFVNLARSQEDVSEVTRFIQAWRDLNVDEHRQVLDIVTRIPMPGDSSSTRFNRIHLNASYQRALFTYPSYLSVDHATKLITSRTTTQIDKVVQEKLGSLKITIFNSLEEWFAYFGDPHQQPSWYTYLSHEVLRAATQATAKAIVVKNKKHLSEEQYREIKQLEIEKGIEDFYTTRLQLLEKGLKLIKHGRQYAIPIGRIDLLCRGADGKYVIVEIKAEEASDSVFGQILRYIGWIHRNLADGKDNARGIILAGEFPETARYSRIGLLKPDHEKFLQFKRHGLNASNT